MNRRTTWPFLFAACAAALPAQIDTITEARVREVVGWLADDARGGRGTPSPGLEESAAWLGKRFAAAGLQQVVAGSWYHDYTLPGTQVASKDLSVSLRRTLGEDKQDYPLVTGQDVRLWRAADVVGGEAEACTVALVDDPVLRQLMRADSGRRPIVLEVPDGHPFWLQAAGDRTTLGARRSAARPVFLVRKDLLPPAVDGKDPAWAVTWKAPLPAKLEVPLHNVVAMLPGTDKKDEYIVVSAHYDHLGIGEPSGGDSIYNGADDDATGTTAVVLLAEALAKEPPLRRSVLFVCFSSEEVGLLGSKAFVAKPPVPIDKIVANVNIEMIGRPEEGKVGKAWITGTELSDFAAICGAALGKQGVDLFEFPPSTMLFAQSDNYSFVPQGIVAHSISAGSLHADYHTVRDEVDRLDIAHMTKIVRGLHDVVRAFADREAKPEWNEAGRKRVERLQRKR